MIIQGKQRQTTEFIMYIFFKEISSEANKAQTETQTANFFIDCLAGVKNHKRWIFYKYIHIHILLYMYGFSIWQEKKHPFEVWNIVKSNHKKMQLT